VTQDLAAAVHDRCVETGFSGVVRVDLDGTLALDQAHGYAHRGWRIRNEVDTVFGIASGTKGVTALTVMSLADERLMPLSAPARSWLGTDLPLIDDRVTVEQLLSHTSGIGDYFDEDALGDIDDYALAVPVSELSTTAAYLPILAGHPMVSEPGERFRYCNSGFVVLALLAERAGGADLPELVAKRVCGPAGMTSTAFLRSDQLPGGAASGYLEGFDGLRTNVLHLPVRGSGDGGLYTTAADVTALWLAMFGGRILRPESVEAVVRPRHAVPQERRRYGLGFWLHATGEAVILEGYDAGVSFYSVHQPSTSSTHTVIANTSTGASPVHQLLEELLGF
jgi:CubicO group peptidase (beta-lactamase class C family)